MDKKSNIFYPIGIPAGKTLLKFYPLTYPLVKNGYPTPKRGRDETKNTAQKLKKCLITADVTPHYDAIFIIVYELFFQVLLVLS